MTSTCINAGVPGAALNPLVSTTTVGEPWQCRFASCRDEMALAFAIACAWAAVRARDASRAALLATPDMACSAIATRPPRMMSPRSNAATGPMIASSIGADPRSLFAGGEPTRNHHGVPGVVNRSRWAVEDCATVVSPGNGTTVNAVPAQLTVIALADVCSFTCVSLTVLSAVAFK